MFCFLARYLAEATLFLSLLLDTESLFLLLLLKLELFDGGSE